jgi:hypothetical protein
MYWPPTDLGVAQTSKPAAAPLPSTSVFDRLWKGAFRCVLGAPNGANTQENARKRKKTQFGVITRGNFILTPPARASRCFSSVKLRSISGISEL